MRCQVCQCESNATWVTGNALIMVAHQGAGVAAFAACAVIGFHGALNTSVGRKARSRKPCGTCQHCRRRVRWPEAAWALHSRHKAGVCYPSRAPNKGGSAVASPSHDRPGRAVHHLRGLAQNTDQGTFLGPVQVATCSHLCLILIQATPTAACLLWQTCLHASHPNFPPGNH